MLSSAILPLILLVRLAKASQLIVEQGGIYSRVSVNVEDQKQPEDCSAFLDNLEVRPNVFQKIWPSFISTGKPIDECIPNCQSEEEEEEVA